ncbi:MAG: hypothetical protein ACHWZW_05615 [Spirulina sp.]
MTAFFLYPPPMSQAITLNLADGSIQFSFSAAAAQALKTDLDALIGQMKAASAAGSPRRTPLPPTEHRHSGDVFLEVFCNPNLWASPFAAKVLITLRDDRIRITTETGLSQLYDDLTTYLDQAT